MPPHIHHKQDDSSSNTASRNGAITQSRQHNYSTQASLRTAMPGRKLAPLDITPSQHAGRCPIAKETSPNESHTEHSQRARNQGRAHNTCKCSRFDSKRMQELCCRQAQAPAWFHGEGGKAIAMWLRFLFLCMYCIIYKHIQHHGEVRATTSEAQQGHTSMTDQ
jgi:hypothetical protein